ncbi:MAG: hypothetical protein IKL84_06845 [Clostridia bacterium]|nr:hypothetical protein [Clostridia bacterium]
MKRAIPKLLALCLTGLFLLGCATEHAEPEETLTADTTLAETTEPVAVDLDLRGYVLVRSEKADEDAIRVASDLYNNLVSKPGMGAITLSDDWVRDAADADNGKPEILIGMTSRPESETARQSLPGYLDWSVSLVEEKLCLTANTIDGLRAASEYFAANLTERDGSLFYTGGNYVGRYDYPLADARIAGVSVGEFSLVYPAGDAVAQRAAERLSLWFAEQTGYVLPLRDDQGAVGKYEILLGKTAHDGSLDSATLEKNTFRIRVNEDQLALAAASLSGYGAIQERLAELFAANRIEPGFDETASHGFANLDGARVLFVGNSFTYYGRCTVNRNNIVNNDRGYFYQAARAMGDEVHVSSFTFNGSILQTDNQSKTSLYDLMLETFPNYYGKGGEMDEFYAQDVVVLQQQNVDMANTKSVIQKFMKLFPPETRFCVFIHHDNVRRNQRNVLGAAEALRDEGSVIYLPVGHLVYDVWTGKTAVPGATLTYDQDSFCVNQTDDRHHPNYLTGYLTALTVYYAITDRSIVDCSHSFVARDLGYYKNGATSNYPEILKSEADMRGLKQLVEVYVDLYNS